MVSDSSQMLPFMPATNRVWCSQNATNWVWKATVLSRGPATRA